MSGLFERPPGNVYRLGEESVDLVEPGNRPLLTSDRLQRRQPLLDLDLASLYDETKGGYGV
jgi:hypothetical protein